MQTAKTYHELLTTTRANLYIGISRLSQQLASERDTARRCELQLGMDARACAWYVLNRFVSALQQSGDYFKPPFETYLMQTCDCCQCNVPDQEIVDRGEYSVCHGCIDNAVAIAVFAIDPENDLIDSEDVPAAIRAAIDDVETDPFEGSDDEV